ncbi:uncharacterized protein LOC143637509, partial [Bidens hawaiensis]|uniref:uncharacterized protein LOC143637509 n=1 Tax=Bidens hawaiensis TaxID=980011 RepID=UPI00404A483C
PLLCCSRFGKFVELQFDKFGRISGAAIRTYLLERSRVCQVSDPERNYHCFYLLCAAPPEEVKKYKLGDPKSFHYLNQSNCFELDGVSDAHDYLATCRAMDIVGISKKEQDAIFRVVASILHLGNSTFSKGEDVDSAILKDEKSKFHLQTTAELPMCDPHALEDALLKRVMVTLEEVIKKSLDPEGAALSRDGLAKTLYSRLFDWLVDKINVSIGQDPNSSSLIGVLDIYGFESFKTNSFEQFYINFTNEKLQQHFNQHVFRMQQDVYNKEEINWSYIEFVDNKDILDLIEKKPGGIISLLDEACMFPKSTPDTFAQKLYQTFKSNKRFIKPKLARSDFIISHYAGEVHYQSDQFLDKNKDYVVPEQQDLLSASKCSFVSGLFPPLREDATKSSKFSSIGSRFKLQLQQLMDTLNSTHPHYIRCVKPNNLLKPAVFENLNILHQLRCGGVLEAIRISCAGYPTHKSFIEFVHRFGLLVPEVLRANHDKEDACKQILNDAGLQGYQIGKTKVFLRAGHMAVLDARRAERLTVATIYIQRTTRSYLLRKRFLAMANLALALQTLCRGKLAAKIYDDMKKRSVSTRIQSNFRRYTLRSSYIRLQHAVVLIQTALRAIAARSELGRKRRHNAAIRLEAKWRAHREYKQYKKLTKATVATQCGWRGRVARRELRRLKMAARDNGALQEAKEKLEKQVKDLTQRLDQQTRLKNELEEALHAKEHEGATKGSDVEKVDSLTAEVKKLTDLLDSERQRADECEKKYSKAQETIEVMRSEETHLKALLESERHRADHSEKKSAEVHETMKTKLEQTEKRAELSDTSIVKEREFAIDASIAALSIAKEAIISMKDTDNINSLTPKENLKAELNDAFIVKERDSTPEASNTTLFIAKDAIESMKDTDKINSLTPKEEKQKVYRLNKTLFLQILYVDFGCVTFTFHVYVTELNDVFVKERESSTEASDATLSIAKEAIDSMKDSPVNNSLTPKEANQKERESATEASDATLSIAKEAIDSMKDSPDNNSLTPKEANQKERESATEASDATLSIAKEAIDSVKDSPDNNSLTSKEANQKERVSATAASDATMSVAKEAIVSMKDTDNISSLTPKEVNHKEHESTTEASDSALSVAKDAIVSMKDADNAKSLTPKEENQKNELNDTFIVKEHESETKASDPALSIVKEAIDSMKDADNTPNLTPKEDSHKIELNTTVVKERESAPETSDETLSIAKEAINSMKDTDNVNNLTPKEENQKEHESPMDVSDVAMSVLNKSPEVTHVKTEVEDGLLTKEYEYGAEVSDEKIDRLTYELGNCKVVLESETQRADEFEKKFSEALETIESMRLKLEETQRRVHQLEEAERRNELNEATLAKKPEPSKDTGETARSTAEMDNLKDLLESKRKRADESEKKYAEALQSMDIMRRKLEEADRKERESPTEALSIEKKAKSSVEDIKKIQSLTADLEKLKAFVISERQRADEFERKYNQALESTELKRKRLAETERKVLQLQDALDRVTYCMSDQFTELKGILRTSSSCSSVTSSFITKNTYGDTTSASSTDITSSDSDDNN